MLITARLSMNASQTIDSNVEPWLLWNSKKCMVLILSGNIPALLFDMADALKSPETACQQRKVEILQLQQALYLLVNKKQSSLAFPRLLEAQAQMLAVQILYVFALHRENRNLLWVNHTCIPTSVRYATLKLEVEQLGGKSLGARSSQNTSEIGNVSVLLGYNKEHE